MDNEEKEESGTCRLCDKQFDSLELFMKHKCREYVKEVIKEGFVPLDDDIKMLEGFKFESNIKNEKLHTIDQGRVIMMPLDFYDEADTIPVGVGFDRFDDYKPAMDLKDWSGNVVLDSVWKK